MAAYEILKEKAVAQGRSSRAFVLFQKLNNVKKSALSREEAAIQLEQRIHREDEIGLLATLQRTGGNVEVGDFVWVRRECACCDEYCDRCPVRQEWFCTMLSRVRRRANGGVRSVAVCLTEPGCRPGLYIPNPHDIRLFSLRYG